MTAPEVTYKPMIDNNGVLRERPPEIIAPIFEPGTLVRLLSKGEEMRVPQLPIKTLDESNAVGPWLKADVVYQMMSEDIATVVEVRLDADESPICKLMVADKGVGWTYSVLLQPIDEWFIPHENYTA